MSSALLTGLLVLGSIAVVVGLLWWWIEIGSARRHMREALVALWLVRRLEWRQSKRQIVSSRHALWDKA